MARRYRLLSETVLFLIIISTTFTNTAIGQTFDIAPEGDVTAPAIKHETPTQTLYAGEPLTIEADVSDNEQITEVILFYRLAGDTEYKRLPMQWTGGTRYLATIPAPEISEPGIEYFLRATDTAGNSAMRGLAFSLLRVKVEPGTEETEPMTVVPMAATRQESPPRKQKKKSSKLLWIVGSAILVGAVVATGGGGGGSDSGNTGIAAGGSGSSGNTGTVTFSGSTP